MVKIWLDLYSDGMLHFKIKDNKDGSPEILFSEFTELFKQNYLKFCPKDKSWVIEPNLTASGLYETLSSYDTDIEISEEDKDLITNSTYPESDELKKIKLNIDKELLEKNPPLKGIEGKENFQIDAILKGLRQRNIIWSISVRHGKTYISCMTIGTLLKLNQIDRILIIARTEGIENFRSEILRFLDGIITENDIGICTTQNREIEDLFDKKIIITNYTTFRLSHKYYQERKSTSKAKKGKTKYINFSKWGTKRLILLDEAQAINNPTSQQSHITHLYQNDFCRHIIMSGSLGYKIEQMYSPCKFVVPQMIPYTYSEWSKFLGLGWRNTINSARVQEFKEKILDKVMVTYSNCIQQTETFDNLIFVQMSDKLKEIYKSACNGFIQDLIKDSDDGKVSGRKFMMKFGTLSSITSDPSLKGVGNWSIKENPKLEVLESLLDKYINEEKRNVIIWGNHPQILNFLGDYFKKYEPLVIHGQSEVDRTQRIPVVMNYQKNGGKLIICNYVLSTSISLTSFTRNIYWDLPLDSNNWEQSKARIRGPMQKEITQSDILMFSNSIDNYIYEGILLHKGEVKNILENKNALTLQDYREVFNPKFNYMDNTY